MTELNWGLWRIGALVPLTNPNLEAGVVPLKPVGVSVNVVWLGGVQYSKLPERRS
ncbi:MAG: hypothetical protein AAF908_03935 [Pseudomonadota bacterium]